jgi:ribosomal protein S18 acetylase RimI-like enzyme
MQSAELEQLADIDRSEIIRTGYRIEAGQLIKMPVEWDSPTFEKDGTGEHSVAGQIAFCRGHVDRGGESLGAFDGKRLAGIIILQPEIRPGLAQLAYLHISRAYRRQGIAHELLGQLESRAKQAGAKRLYVSAIPSESAIGFYSSQGFQLTPDPIPELFELEPQDIHMIKELNEQD